MPAAALLLVELFLTISEFHLDGSLEGCRFNN